MDTNLYNKELNGKYTKANKKLFTIIAIIFFLSFNITFVSSIEYLEFEKGWNLVSFEILPEDPSIENVFPKGALNNIISIWGWTEDSWSFYSPQEDDFGKSYAEKKGFGMLKELSLGKGYWVNLNKSLTINFADSNPALTVCKSGCDAPSLTQALNGITNEKKIKILPGVYEEDWSDLFDASLPNIIIEGSGNTLSLKSGWNLIGFNSLQEAVSLNEFLDAAGKDNFISIWGWDTDKNKWEVSVLGDDDGGEFYASSKGFGFLEEIAPKKGYWINIGKATKINFPLLDSVVIKHSGSEEEADRDGLRILPGSTIRDLTIDCGFVVDAIGLVEGLWDKDPDGWENVGQEYIYNVENININSCTVGVLATPNSHNRNQWYPVEGDHYFNHKNINFVFDERYLTLSEQQSAEFELAAGARWRVTPDPGYKPNLFLNYDNVNNFIFELEQKSFAKHIEHNCFAMINNRMGDPAEHMKVNIHTVMDGFNCYVYIPDIEKFVTTLWEIRNDFGSEQVSNEDDRSYDTIEFRNSYWNYMAKTDCEIYSGTISVENNSKQVFAYDEDFMGTEISYGNWFSVVGTNQERMITSATSNKLSLKSEWTAGTFTDVQYRICKGHVYGMGGTPESDPDKPDITACIFDNVSVIVYDPIKELTQKSLVAPDMGPYSYGDPIYPRGGIANPDIENFCDSGDSYHDKIYTNLWTRFYEKDKSPPEDHLVNYRSQSQPECNDGVDNDGGDYDPDFPNDPDCESPFDTTEIGSASFVCSDGIDNDFDGDVDWPYDKDCWGATDNDECRPGTNPGNWIDYYFEDGHLFSKLEIIFNWKNLPTKKAGIYPALLQFGFEEGSGGYMGPQVTGVDSSGNVKKSLLFSIWDGCDLELDEASCDEHTAIPWHENCQYFGGEGTGAQCFINTDGPLRFSSGEFWEEDKEYKMIVEKEMDVEDGVIWRAVIQDIETSEGILIGKIKLKDREGKKGYGLLKSHTRGFFEYFLSDNALCDEAEYTQIIRKGPVGDGKWLARRSTSANQVCCLKSKQSSQVPGIVIGEYGEGVERPSDEPKVNVLWEFGSDIEKTYDSGFWKSEYDKDLTSLCGDGLCDGEESAGGCYMDCVPNLELDESSLSLEINDVATNKINYKISFDVNNPSVYDYNYRTIIHGKVRNCFKVAEDDYSGFYFFKGDDEINNGDNIEVCKTNYLGFDDNLELAPTNSQNIEVSQQFKKDNFKISVAMCPEGSTYQPPIMFPMNARCVFSNGGYQEIIMEEIDFKFEDIVKRYVDVGVYGIYDSDKKIDLNYYDLRIIKAFEK